MIYGKSDYGDNDGVPFIELLANVLTELRRANKSDDGDNDGYVFLDLPANVHNELACQKVRPW